MISSDPVTPQRIITYWNETVTRPLRAARVTAKRIEKLKTRIKDHPDWKTWETGIQHIEDSLFARGLNGWLCSLDSLAERRDLIVRAAEGRYDYQVGGAPTLETVARQLRRQHHGCTHDPRCKHAAACIEQIVWGLFEAGEREPPKVRKRGLESWQ